MCVPMSGPKHSCVSSVKKHFKPQYQLAKLFVAMATTYFATSLLTSDSGDCGEISVGPRYELRKAVGAAEPSHSLSFNLNNNTRGMWQRRYNRRMQVTRRAMISPFQIPISLCSPGDTTIQGATHTDTEGSAAGKPPQGCRTGNRGLDICQTHAFSNTPLSHRSLSKQTHSARMTLAQRHLHQLP